MGDDEMDSLFGEFMNQVTNIKSNKMKKLEGNIGTADEIIDRLTKTRYDPKQGVGSPYFMLMISPESSESEVTKTYRKMSVLIHPDKCKLEGSAEAFQILVQAYNDTKNAAYSDKYKDVLPQAKNRVREFRKKENKDRAKRGEDPLDMEGNEFDKEVLKECDRMTGGGSSGSAEDNDYGNEVLAANMKRQSDLIRQSKEAKKEEIALKRKFEKERDKRAAGWQIFVNKIDTKKFKSDTFAKVGKVGAGNFFHKPEERKETDGVAKVDLDDKYIMKSNAQAGQTGIDRADRKQWR